MSSMQWAGSARTLLGGAKVAVGCGRAAPALDYVGSASTALVARQHGVAPNQGFK